MSAEFKFDSQLFASQNTKPSEAPTKPKVDPAYEQGQETLNPDTSVISVERAAFGGVLGTSFPRVNLDKLVAKKGLRIYAEMRVDEQVKAVVNFKRDAILSRGWTFEFDGESKLPDKEQKQRVRVFEKIIEKMPGSFLDALSNISLGREFGYSLTEKVYAVIDVDGSPQVGLSSLRGRDPETFNFYVDPWGDLERCEQIAAGKLIEIDLDKFIHYVHNPEFDVYLGRSDLREAYRSWYAKDQTIKFWNFYMEKLGGGLVIAKLTPDSNIVFNTPQYNALVNVLQSMKATGSVLFPKGVEADVLFPTSSDSFKDSIAFHDLAIAKALLVPNLLGISNNAGHGSFAQSQTQLDAFAWTVKADTDRLEACLNEQLFKDLGEQNWGDGEYPCFKFKPPTTEYSKWLTETWLKLVIGKAVLPTVDDEKRLRELMEMPPRNDDTELVVDPMLEIQQQNATDTLNTQHGLDQKAADAQVQRGIKEDVTRATNPVLSAEKEKERQAQIAAAAAKGKKGFKKDDVSTEIPAHARGRTHLHAVDQRTARISLASARERVDFAVIDQKQKLYGDKLAGDMSQIVARGVNQLLGDDENLKALTDKDTSDIGMVEFSGVTKGRLKTTVARALQDSWNMGRQMASDEIRKTKAPRKMSDARYFSDLRKTAADYFESNSFRMAGNVSDGVRAVIQQELQNSVKYGKSPQQTRETIWDRLTSKGFVAREDVKDVETDEDVQRGLDALWVDDELAAAHYLDTLARTNLFEAFNEARYGEFKDPALDGFVVALRYSAVLDEHTTEICQELNDHVYNADSEVWDTYRPPNHYNCRSILIPITQVDVQQGDWDGEESESPDDMGVEPQDGFK